MGISFVMCAMAARLGDSHHGRRVFLVATFGFRDGVMGGNLWFMGTTAETALNAAEAAAAGLAPFRESSFRFWWRRGECFKSR